jgi:hypothetical protein
MGSMGTPNTFTWGVWAPQIHIYGAVYHHNYMTTEQTQLSRLETIDSYVQETINRFKEQAETKKVLIRNLADKIAAIPGIDKKLIARTMVGRFRKLGYQINKRYVYDCLSIEYKDEEISKTAKDNNAIRNENGYDAKLHDYFDPKKFNVNEMDSYTKKSLQLEIDFLFGEKKKLENQIAELETENTKLKNIVAELTKPKE